MKNPMIDKEASEEMTLWNKVYNQYCAKKSGATFYVLHEEHIGNYIVYSDSYYPKSLRSCETSQVTKIMKTAIKRWESVEAAEESIHLTMNVCRNVVVIPSNKASKELRKWFWNYYFPDDFYENLAVARDRFTGTYYIWNRKEETPLAEYLTPEQGDPSHIIFFYKNIKN